MDTVDQNVFSAMQLGKPYKSYKKGILAEVYVTILNSWDGKPSGTILRGDPRKNEPESIIDVWSEKEDMFFRRMNASHFKSGTLVAYERPEEVTVTEEEKTNGMTDDEMLETLNSPFFKLMKVLNNMTSVVPVTRILEIAETEDKSKKILDAIKKRLAELETIEYKK